MIKKKILILGASSDIGVELIKVLRSKKKWEIHAHCNSNSSTLKKMFLEKIIIGMAQPGRILTKVMPRLCLLMKKNFVQSLTRIPKSLMHEPLRITQ